MRHTSIKRNRKLVRRRGNIIALVFTLKIFIVINIRLSMLSCQSDTYYWNLRAAQLELDTENIKLKFLILQKEHLNELKC